MTKLPMQPDYLDTANDLSPHPLHFHCHGKDFYLLGTAHLSKQSVSDTKTAIHQLQPDTVCIELCWSRYHAMINEGYSQPEPSFKELFFSRRCLFNLAQYLLLLFYKKLGKQLDIKPGAEMLAAIEVANQIGATILPVDRDVEVTLNRAWRALSFREKITLACRSIFHIFTPIAFTQKSIEELKEPNNLNSMINDFASQYPNLKYCMIDERDHWLAESIFTADGQTIFAVLGAGHIPGVLKNLTELSLQHIDSELTEEWDDNSSQINVEAD